MFNRLWIACLLAPLGWFVASPALALEGIDVTARTQMRVLGQTLDRGRGTSTAVVLIRNTSGAPIHAPLSLLITRIGAPGVSLVNASWQTPEGTPLVDLPIVRNTLNPGAWISVRLRFSNPDRVRRFTFGHVVLGFPVARPSDLPVGVDVRLTADAIAPGEEVGIAWRLTGGRPPKQSGIQVRVRAPGLTATVAGTGWSNPGLPPPAGAVHDLANGGVWQEAQTNYLDNARAGRVTVALPSATEGAWSIEVAVVDRGSGSVVASATRTVIVSGEPALYLRLSRPVANSLDAVRATLVTTAGATPRPVRVLAWLVAPDGSQFGLPGLTPNHLQLREGPSRDERITLLDHVLGSDGQGAYEVHARLFDATTGTLLGRASAGVEVCDTPGSLGGVVRRHTGEPVSGDNPLRARVTAFDVDDAAVTADGAIGAAGAYTLALAPGRYLIAATVIDADGVHTARSQTMTRIGCAGAALTLDLTLDPPLQPVASALAGIPAPAAGPGQSSPSRSIAFAAGTAEACDEPGVPRPGVIVAGSNGGAWRPANAPGTPDILLDVLTNTSFTGELRSLTPGITYVTHGEVRAALRDAESTLLEGGEVDLEALAGQVGKEFLISLRFDPGFPRTRTSLVVRVTRVADRAVLRSVQRLGPLLDDDFTGVEAMVESAARETAQNLLCDLQGERQRPVRPVLAVTLTPDTVTPGGVVQAEVTLADSDGTARPGKPVRIEYTRPPDAFGQPSTEEATTDVSGKVTLPLLVRSDTVPGPGKVVARFLRDGEPFGAPSPDRFYRVANPNGALALSAGRTALRVGATEPIDVSLRKNGVPVSGAVVTLEPQGTGGSVSAPTVVTDAEGRATVDFQAGTATGLADITATYQPPANSPLPPPITETLTLVVDGAVAFGLSAADTTSGGTSRVVADLDLGGARLARVPITFRLEGPGGLNATTAQTDQFGRAEVIYVAPAEESGTATVTAQAVVDGQTYARTATFQIAPVDRVSFALSAANTVAGGRTSVIADLAVGGAGQAGIPVTFTLAGPGTLSAAAAQTDGAGRAEVTYFAAEANAGVTVTAEAVVDGRTYTRTATFQVAPVSGPLVVRFVEVEVCFLETGYAGNTFFLSTCSSTSGPLPLQLSADDSSIPYRSGLGSTVEVRVTSSGVDVDASIRPQTCCGLGLITIAFVRVGFQFEGGLGGTLTGSTNTGWLDPLPPNPTQRPEVTLRGNVSSGAGSQAFDFDFVSGVGTPVAGVQISRSQEDEEDNRPPFSSAGFELRILNTLGLDETGFYSDPVSGGGRILTITP